MGQRVASDFWILAGMAKLTSVLPKLKILHTLNLQRNDIGDEGIIHLSGALSQMPGLRNLNIGNNSFADRGMSTLSASLQKLLHLERLDVDHIGCKSVEVLESMSGALPNLRCSTAHKANVVSYALRPVTPPTKHLADWTLKTM